MKNKTNDSYMYTKPVLSISCDFDVSAIEIVPACALQYFVQLTNLTESNFHKAKNVVDALGIEPQ